MRFLLVFIFLFLYAEQNITQNIYIQKILQIDNKLLKMDFYIKYQQYQTLIQLKYKLEQLKAKIHKLELKHQTKNLETLKLQKIAYQKQLEIMKGGKENLFDAIISMDSLPKPFNITNPFGIISAINYVKKIQEFIKKYEEKYKELDEIIALLKEKKEYLKQLSKNTSKIDKEIQDFILAKTIYSSKLTQLKTQANLYIQTMKDEEKAQINKLITLIVIIFLSILFFTLIKLALKKYAQNLENIYLINKIINILNISVVVLIIAFFYIDNATYLITILGFASAGIAIAMKDWFMNIFGWFVILSTGNFKVGDRIKVILQNGQIEIVGDVIDITVSRIVIHEDVTLSTYTKNRRAGRIVFVPNNVVFTNPIFNYTHNGLRAVWDGIDMLLHLIQIIKKLNI
jgi:small-conductance mechanosensitive channel